MELLILVEKKSRIEDEAKFRREMELEKEKMNKEGIQLSHFGLF